MRKVRLPLAAVLTSFVLFFLALEYPWQLAMLLALAFGALAYSTARTVENLRALFAPGGIGPVQDSGAWLTPGEEEQGGEQQEVHERGRSQAPKEQRQPTGEKSARENESS